MDLQTRGDLLLFQSIVAKLLTASKTCGVVPPVKVPIWLPLLCALFHEESMYTATTESRFSGTWNQKSLIRCLLDELHGHVESLKIRNACFCSMWCQTHRRSNLWTALCCKPLETATHTSELFLFLWGQFSIRWATTLYLSFPESKPSMNFFMVIFMSTFLD